MLHTRKRLLAAAVLCLAAAGPVASVQASDPDTGIKSGAKHYLLPRGSAASNAAVTVDNLTYKGGPVEVNSSINYAIFWEPLKTKKVNKVSPNYNNLVVRFLQDVGGSALYGLSTQYYQLPGPQFIQNSSGLGGAVVDQSLYPGPVIYDLYLQLEITKVMQKMHWTGGIGHEFFVYTASNELICSTGGCSNTVYCAYHGSFQSGGQTVLYAAMPYPTTVPVGCDTPSSPNGDRAADDVINVTSHELIETVTDPLVGVNPAWTDSVGQEIGDKCNFTFGPTDGSGADVYMNGHPYIVQQEWSNRASGCSLS